MLTTDECTILKAFRYDRRIVTDDMPAPVSALEASGLVVRFEQHGRWYIMPTKRAMDEAFAVKETYDLPIVTIPHQKVWIAPEFCGKKVNVVVKKFRSGWEDPKSEFIWVAGVTDNPETLEAVRWLASTWRSESFHEEIGVEVRAVKIPKGA